MTPTADDVRDLLAVLARIITKQMIAAALVDLLSRDPGLREAVRDVVASDVAALREQLDAIRERMEARERD